MAQLVEQLIRNQQVAGSSPASSSKIKGVLWGSFYFGDLPNLAPGEGRPGRDRQKHLPFLSCLILQRSLFRRTCGLREVKVYVVLLTSPASSSKIKGVLWGSFYFGDLPNLAPGEGRPGRDRQKHLPFLSCLILQRSLFRRTCGWSLLNLSCAYSERTKI